MIYDLIGIIGVALLIYAYFLLQTERISIQNVKYSLMNMAGSILIIISLVEEFNLPSFIIESFWVLISGIGVVRYIKNRFKKKAYTQDT